MNKRRASLIDIARRFLQPSLALRNVPNAGNRQLLLMVKLFAHEAEVIGAILLHHPRNVTVREALRRHIEPAILETLYNMVSTTDDRLLVLEMIWGGNSNHLISDKDLLLELAQRIELIKTLVSQLNGDNKKQLLILLGNSNWPRYITSETIHTNIIRYETADLVQIDRTFHYPLRKFAADELAKLGDKTRVLPETFEESSVSSRSG